MKARGGGSFGMLVLAVVLGIVLLLVARSWRSVAPQAAAIAAPPRPEAVAGQPTEPGELPDLRETQRRTDAHAQQVRDALAEAD